jgi:hypothetical protein
LLVMMPARGAGWACGRRSVRLGGVGTRGGGFAVGVRDDGGAHRGEQVRPVEPVSGCAAAFSNCSLLHTISTWMTPDLHHRVPTMTAGGATANDLEGLSRPAPQAAGWARPGTIRLHEGRIGPVRKRLDKVQVKNVRLQRSVPAGGLWHGSDHSHVSTASTVIYVGESAKPFRAIMRSCLGVRYAPVCEIFRIEPGRQEVSTTTSRLASKRLCQGSCGTAEAQSHLELCWKLRVWLRFIGVDRVREPPRIVPESALHSWVPKMKGKRERRTNVT